MDGTAVFEDGGLTSEYLEKYDVSAPRYTSYPTVPVWSDKIGQEEYQQCLIRLQQTGPAALYIHIPFCEQRCYFCGCNVIAARRREIAAEYLERLDAEMRLLADALTQTGKPPPLITQIHFGGGTPTYLSCEQLIWLYGRIQAHFMIDVLAEVSIETDPCVTTTEHLKELRILGFNRISFGIQDFHAKTQQTIRRIQSIDETRRLTEHARAFGFTGINYDLIYGLPCQTVRSFDITLDVILALRPDRVALYNFAYLPEKFSHQRKIDPKLLPDRSTRFQIFSHACRRFLDAGYVYIGLDHFALPDDELTKALHDNRLYRSFMGYTTIKTAHLYSFGVSAISMLDALYVQNVKKLSRYFRMIDSGVLPVDSGISLTHDDKLRRGVIQSLMCNGVLDKHDFQERYDTPFDGYFAKERKRLRELREDGLLIETPDRLELTHYGRILSRIVAMTFDVYLGRPHAERFSRTL